LRPHLGAISGNLAGGQSFSGITDIVGGESPTPGKDVRTALQDLNPGKLILELPSLYEDLGTVDVELTVPDDFPCPTGTEEKRCVCEN